MKKLLLLTAIFALAATACDKEEGNTGEPYRVYTDEVTMQGDFVVFHGHMSKFLSRDVSGSGSIYFLVTVTSGDYEEGHTIKVPCTNRVDENFTGAHGSFQKGKLIYYKACVDRGSKTYFGEEKSVQLPVERVKISPIYICFDAQTTRQAEFTWIPEGTPKPEVRWEVLDPSIATVDKDGVLTGLKKGKTKLRLTPTLGGNYDEIDLVVRNHYKGSVEVVDLGLSVVWACNSVSKTGLNAIEFFAWGETDPKMGYELFDKDHYNPLHSTPNSRLQADEDIATLALGPAFRTPTKAEFEELLKYTDVCTQIRGNWEGLMFTSKVRQNSDGTYPTIFFPFYGYRAGSSNPWEKCGFLIWTSDYYNNGKAWAFSYFTNGSGNKVPTLAQMNTYNGANVYAVVD